MDVSRPLADAHEKPPNGCISSARPACYPRRACFFPPIIAGDKNQRQLGTSALALIRTAACNSTPLLVINPEQSSRFPRFHVAPFRFSPGSFHRQFRSSFHSCLRVWTQQNRRRRWWKYLRQCVAGDCHDSSGCYPAIHRYRIRNEQHRGHVAGEQRCGRKFSGRHDFD